MTATSSTVGETRGGGGEGGGTKGSPMVEQ